MKKISADYIFCGNSSPIKNGVVVIADNGVILEVLNPAINTINWGEVEQHKGIICPGFVNTHCHLELAYLKGKIAAKKQLQGFIQEIVAVRGNFTDEERQIAIVLAEKEMIANGIVAVGDIANGNATFIQKAKENLQYHTFVEVFGLNNNDAQQIIERAINLKSSYFNQNQISITAHAPYSMSNKLMNLVNEISGNILSIHNQETGSENELFLTKSGTLYERLANFNEAIKKWVPTGKNALPSYLPNFGADKKILLVHNTFTSQKDIAFAKDYAKNIYWCFCPNANLYIENTLPNFNLFVNEKCTIGTDSLASNNKLSILDEMKTIAKKSSKIPLEMLIKWATYNGAQFLNRNKLGSIEKGKTPGLNLLENVDLTNLKLKFDTKVEPLTKIS